MVRLVRNQFPWVLAVLWSCLLGALKALLAYSAWSLGKNPQLCTWDCGYYKDIALFGYSYKVGQPGTLAFFPVFPLLIKYLMPFMAIHSFALTGIVFNLALYPLLMLLFIRWCWEIGWPRKTLWLPALLWTADRFTLWAFVPYTETLFCTLLFIFLLLARRWTAQTTRVSFWLFLCALTAGLASGLRLVGLSFIASLELAKWKWFLKRPLWALLACFVGSLGLLSFFAYVHMHFGSWTLSPATTATWGRKADVLSLPVNFAVLVKRAYFPTLIVLISFIWVSLKGLSRLKLSATERILCFLLFLLPMMNTIPVSLTRYLSILYLAYLGWARGLEILFNSKKWRFLGILLLILYLSSELYWQIKLGTKFFQNEVFNWAS